MNSALNWSTNTQYPTAYALSLNSGGNININAPMTWNANTLTLNATNGIYVNSIMTVSGTGSLAASYSTLPVTDVYIPPYGLYMAKGSTNGIEDGTYAGRIDFSGTGTLTLNNHPYTVYQTLSALTNAINTDTTRTRLSAITPSVQT